MVTDAPSPDSARASVNILALYVATYINKFVFIDTSITDGIFKKFQPSFNDGK